MLFLGDHLGHALPGVIGEGFGGMFEPAVERRGFRGRHGRRQVDQQTRIDGEAAHDFKRRSGVFLADDDVARQVGFDDALADDVLDIEPVAVAAACRVGDRPHGFGIDTGGVDLDDILFGIAQGRQLAAEDAAGVDVQCMVQPFDLRHRGVPVDQHGLAAIVAGPVMADRQAEFIDLAGGLAIHGEAADARRAAADIMFLQAGVGYGQSAAVEDIVAHQAVEKGDDVALELAAFMRHLLQRFRQAVIDRDVAALQSLFQLVVMVAGDAEGDARRAHVDNEAQDLGRLGATVDQVADEDQLAPFGVRDDVGRGAFDNIAELAHQGFEFVEAAVNIADQVEGARDVLLVVPQLLAFDAHGVDGFGRIEDRDLGELLLQALQGLAQGVGLAPDHALAEIPVWPCFVAFKAELSRQVEHEGDGDDMVLARQVDQRSPGFGLDIGGVDDGQLSRCEALAGDEVQDLKGVLGRRLVVFVVADQTAAII